MKGRMPVKRSVVPGRRRGGIRRRGPAPRPGGTRRRGWLLAVLAVLVAAVLVLHGRVPNSVGNLGSLLETFLPWVGLAVPLLAVGALVRRSTVAAVTLLAPALVWTVLFGQLVLPGKGGGDHDLRVVTHNVDAANTDHPRTASDLLGVDADVIALEEVDASARRVYAQALAARYPYTVRRGTIGLWSKYPLTDAGSVDIGLTWTRALRAEVRTPSGAVALYVAHLASVRVGSAGFTAGQRNETIESLGQAIGDERLRRVVVMGDFNGTANDRSLAPVTSGLRSAQGVAGDGFGFSWPAFFPMARIDHVLVRGVEPTRAWVLPRTGSDHRPVAADLRF